MVHKKQIIIASLLTFLALIPATIFFNQSPQDTRSRATASTTISYTPVSTESNPIEKKVNDEVAIDVFVTPGSNLPSLIKLEMTYDGTKFQPAQVPFVVNTTAFPTTVEGPAVLDGKVAISVSIGSDTTKVIQQVTKVGTLHLIAKAPTNVPSQISFGTSTQVLSLAQSDEATENVLSSTGSTYIMIDQGDVIPTATEITPLPTATITQVPTIIPTTVPTISLAPNATSLTFRVFLHGIGSSGDNANAYASDLSNKTPLHPTRDVLLTIYNDQNQLTASPTGSITYDSASGSYIGTILLGDNVPLGDYTVRVKEPTHLGRLVSGILRITPQSNTIMPDITVAAGDINGDNKLNILDYSLLVGCYSDLLPAIDCTDANKVLTDLNDNGAVNQFDYNLFLREITVQSGN